MQAENTDQKQRRCSPAPQRHQPLPLAEAGTEGIVDVSPQDRTQSAFESTRIYWTLKTNVGNGNAFQLARNSLDTLQPKTIVDTCVAISQRLAVTTEQTTADD